MKNFEMWLMNESTKADKLFQHCDECPAYKYCEDADDSLDCTAVFKQWALTDVEEEV